MVKKAHLNALIFAGLLLFSGLPAAAQDTPRLVPGQQVEREIKGGDAHLFSVQLEAGQTARIEIVQKGVDVSLAGINPAGEKYIETESPSGLTGTDLILLASLATGEYKVQVSPADPRAALGKYFVKLAEVRASVPQDDEINAAARKIMPLAEETNVLRQKGTREGRRQAIEKFGEIIALSKIKQDRSWEIVGILTSGLMYEQLGELQSARDLYIRGLALAREAGNRQYEGSSLNNLGAICLTVGDYEKAIVYLEQAILLQRETGNKRGEGSNLNNFGTAYLLLGDLKKAEDYYIRALALRREIKDRRGEAFALNNLGQVFLRSGDMAKASDYFGQALALRREIKDLQGESATLRNLGQVFYSMSDKTKAGEYFANAIAVAKQAGDRRVEADTLYWIALGEKEKGDLQKAIESLENGLRLIEQTRGELVSADARASYFSTVQQFYELYIEILAARHEKEKDPRDIALALQMSERARTRSLIDLLQEARININKGADPKLLEQARELQDTINAKYRQQMQLRSGSGTGSDPQKLTNDINSLTRELEELQGRIRRENPRYADLTQGTTLSAAEIQALLDEDTVLLEYKLGQTRSFMWVVTKDSVRMFTLPARADIEAAAGNLYTAIVSRGKAGDAQTNELARRLGDMLTGPAAAGIRGKRLAIVADGVLQFTPFSALVPNEIVTLPSAGVLAELRRGAADRKAPSKTIAVFADAVFDVKDPRLGKMQPNASPKPGDLSSVLRDFGAGEDLPRLLASRIEAREILRLAPKELAVSNMDFEANRENASSDVLSDYRVLHFATHGLLDTKHPEFSGLVFSLFDANGKPRDGFLRLNQIYNLNLNSDLVVLSACQTALGKDVRGEGLIGLTRGFMYAGAKRVVASLWKVEDSATAEFMKRFYQNLLVKKLPPAAALRQAQVELKQIPRFRSPYFWAGFALQGEWR